MRQIIAIGGGGFGREIGELKIERYIKEQSNKKNPKICFIPTATGDDASYIENFYKAFNSLECITSHIDFFKRTIDLKPHILDQDIIYVGGGNTKSMLAVWREWGLDSILKEAYANNIIMSGVSAGAICWFEKGITDSWAHDLAVMDCLGFVNGICCPHYDEEPARRPFVKKALNKDLVDHCLSVEGNCALHLKDDIPFRAINFGNNKNAYMTSLKDGKVFEDAFERIDL